MKRAIMITTVAAVMIIIFFLFMLDNFEVCRYRCVNNHDCRMMPKLCELADCEAGCFDVSTAKCYQPFKQCNSDMMISWFAIIEIVMGTILYDLAAHTNCIAIVDFEN